ncbi:MAG TPA: hypothetical protein VJT78_08735 [Candidatus Dormibacteraeota bacterium]|nr:hypothetical protein [Candidatus Dormibacteraeota bacterium]
MRWRRSSKREPDFPPQPEHLLKLRRLWNEHIHQPFPSATQDPRAQEVTLYGSWVGSMVDVALGQGSLDAHHALMLETRRSEGNRDLFRAAGDLGEPIRSYVARLIAIEDLLAELPVE